MTKHIHIHVYDASRPRPVDPQRLQRLAQALKIVKAGRCPDCGTRLYRNLSLTGWYQCGHYGSPGFQREPGPHCNFQTFYDPSPRDLEELRRQGATDAADPKTMGGATINAELEKLDQQRDKLVDEFIAAGRGHERPSEYLRMSDPLAMRARAISERRSALQREAERRYGPSFHVGCKLGGPTKSAW